MKCKARLFLTLVLAFLAVACLNQGAAKSVQNTSSLKTNPVNAGTPANQDQWFEITAPDADFVAAFPKKPEFVIGPPNQYTRITREIRAATERYTFYISYFDFSLKPGTLKNYNQVKLRQEQETRLLKDRKQAGWRLLSRKSLAGNGYQHVFYVPASDLPRSPAYFRGMAFIHDLRVYTISFTAPAQAELFGPEAKRFFDSFKFINP